MIVSRREEWGMLQRVLANTYIHHTSSAARRLHRRADESDAPCEARRDVGVARIVSCRVTLTRWNQSDLLINTIVGSGERATAMIGLLRAVESADTCHYGYMETAGSIIDARWLRWGRVVRSCPLIYHRAAKDRIRANNARATSGRVRAW